MKMNKLYHIWVCYSFKISMILQRCGEVKRLYRVEAVEVRRKPRPRAVLPRLGSSEPFK